jgi:SulP family sulfate permease
MPPAVPVPTSASHWIRESLAGLAGTMATLAVPLTLGLLAFAALGPSAAAVGIPAALATTVVAGITFALGGRAAMPAAGPSSATALILSGLVIGLVQDAAADTAAVVAIAGLAVVLSGALQVLLALLGLARLARFVPRPVLAGFMNGVALLIVLGQLPLLLGARAGTPLAQALAGWQPLALLLGLGTALLLWLAARRWPRLPAAPVALLLGTAVHLVLQALAPAAGAGQAVGPLPDGLAAADALLPLWTGTAALALLQQHAALVVATAAALALVGALESALNTLAVDQTQHAHHEPRRELLALGLSNMVCGLFGGLPAVALRARAIAVLQAGGHSRQAVVGGSLLLGVLVLLAAHWLAWLPLPVLAGVMLVVALSLFDRWSLGLALQWRAGAATPELRRSAALVLLVCVVTLWQGFVVAVAVGVLLSTLRFVATMSQSLVRARYTAAARPSRRIYPAAVEAQLQPLRAQVLVLELEGALFFGSTERLLDEAGAKGAMGAMHTPGAPDVQPRCVVLDLQHVGSIDETAALALQQLQARLRQRGASLRLAGVVADAPRVRALQAAGNGIETWPDIDRAVEAAERELLGPATLTTLSPVPLEDSLLLHGLDAADRALITAQMQRRQLAAGERLFDEGDPADCLYVLEAGSLSVVSAPRPGVPQQRYLSLLPGMMLGETAMLDGGGRTAAAVADTAAVVHALTLDSLQALDEQHPRLASRLHRNIALHL